MGHLWAVAIDAIIHTFSARNSNLLPHLAAAYTKEYLYYGLTQNIRWLTDYNYYGYSVSSRTSYVQSEAVW